MTACGFCVVAALSSQTSGLPWTRSRRIGKSRWIDVRVEEAGLDDGVGAGTSAGVTSSGSRSGSTRPGASAGGSRAAGKLGPAERPARSRAAGQRRKSRLARAVTTAPTAPARKRGEARRAAGGRRVSGRGQRRATTSHRRCRASVTGEPTPSVTDGGRDVARSLCLGRRRARHRRLLEHARTGGAASAVDVPGPEVRGARPDVADVGATRSPAPAPRWSARRPGNVRQDPVREPGDLAGRSSGLAGVPDRGCLRRRAPGEPGRLTCTHGTCRPRRSRARRARRRSAPPPSSRARSGTTRRPAG